MQRFGTPRGGEAREEQVPSDPKGFEDWAYDKLQAAFGQVDPADVNALYDAIWETIQVIYKASYRNGRGSRSGGYKRSNRDR